VADPIAALVIAGVALKEGRDAWRGDACCAPNVARAGEPSAGDRDDCPDDCCAGER